MGHFRKMHGLGNDFVIIDARDAPLSMSAARARAIADRREGIGCDQLVLIEAPTDAAIADVRLRFFNADGSEVESCGNASRAVALMLGGTQRLETLGGILDAQTLADSMVSVTMGVPRRAWDAIPLAYAMDSAHMPVAWEELADPAAVNVGNPHVIFFVEDVDAVPLDRLGPLIEHDPLFPERVNVNIATITGPQSLRLRVWERGAGLTRACGTGACATAVAALDRRLVRGAVQVDLPGGRLTIALNADGAIEMTGGASLVFEGEADWDAFG